MTKKQEEIFKEFVYSIECKSKDLEYEWNNWEDNKPSKDILRIEKSLREVRIAFFEWAKKNFK